MQALKIFVSKISCSQAARHCTRASKTCATSAFYQRYLASNRPNFKSFTPIARTTNKERNSSSFGRHIAKMRSVSYLTDDGELNKKAFTKHVEVWALRVDPARISMLMKALQDHLLNIPRFKNVHPDPIDSSKRSQKKILLLSESIKSKDLTELPEDVRQLALSEGTEVIKHSLEIDYNLWTVEQILSKILPPDIDIPSAFETIGHIAHMNLRENQLPYKKVIGQVILEKNPSIRTVVHKTSSIETEYRTFPMEVIAGENNMMVEVHESNARLRFNFAEVYWNSRLQFEHKRVIDCIPECSIVCDMMCGVGPFAIPLGLKRVRVYANDLNPKSFEFLEENIKKNKVSKYVSAHNSDGRQFVRKLAQEGVGFTHVIMNLPATALLFLDVFRDLLGSCDRSVHVYCYCFSKEEAYRDDVIQRAEDALQAKLHVGSTKVHDVRSVSPSKKMLCLEFDLAKCIATNASKRKNSADHFGKDRDSKLQRIVDK